LAILALALGRTAVADSDNGTISPAQAAAAVSAFLLLEGQSISPAGVVKQAGTAATIDHPDLGVLLTFRGALGTLWISRRGNVVYYAGNTLRATGKPAPDQALALARQFVERHITDFASRNFEQEKPHFDRSRATFRWVEKIRQGMETAIFPNSAEVVMDLEEGRVVRFNATDLRLLRTTPPRLSEAEARVRIRAQFQKSAIEDIDLMLLPAKNGGQPVTVWTALVMTMGPEGPRVERVTINADTGELMR
jgi:hypothetical protein